ncbi:hypothetical protein DUI87_02948 [Hirundo rustica rustica]|uniref:ribonuclease H n=1 Tax=Hirundo rustica rustica TaxID=333673 RepID=A0A3M0LAN4_HIRRU|nr:hypothetical protein DUI87_02948 [Hirundo rustica rustica]
MALADADEQCKAAILSLSTEPAPTLHDMLQVCARKIPFIKAHQNHNSRVKPPQKAAADTMLRVPWPLPKRGTTCLLCDQAGHWASQCHLKKPFLDFRDNGGGRSQRSKGNFSKKLDNVNVKLNNPALTSSAFQQESPDMIVKDLVTRETKSPHDQVTWGHGLPEHYELTKMQLAQPPQHGELPTQAQREQQAGVEELLVHRMYRGLWEFVDLLEQLEAKIIFKNGEISLEVKDQQYVELLSLMLITKEIEVASEKENFRKIMDQVFPGVWASNIPGRAKNALPVQIRLKEGGQPVRVKQYPLKKEDIDGVSPIIENFLQLGLLRECQSDFNTPILPVKKPDGSYRLVQDLRAVNKVTKDLYPVVANPYTLLTRLTPELTWFTVLDLKDAFFCLPLHEARQKMFAFERESPKTGRKTQLTWCVLPQGYKNSPTIFGEQLAKDLESWEPPPGEGQLLQYVDELLIATQTQETCVDWTVSLLNFLDLQGYRVSQKKAQMVRQTVIYLGYKVSAGQRTLGQDCKEAMCQTPKPQTVKELRTFLGMTGWCRLWIYNYGLLVKPLYALITEGSRDLQWTKDATRAFDRLKKALMSAPALGLPDVSKPFFLCSHKKQGIALGILAQNLGPYRRAVAYLSKQLDTAAKGWPGCLRAVCSSSNKHPRSTQIHPRPKDDCASISHNVCSP